MIQTAGGPNAASERERESEKKQRQKKIMNETFGEHSLLDYAWAWSGVVVVECRRNRGNLYSLAMMENKLFVLVVVTFECLQFIPIDRISCLARDEWESSQVDRLIINYFVIQIPAAELIIYAPGKI